jgi:hypothetical protein
MTRHACGRCGAKYDSMQAALLCCDPDFDTNPDPPADAYGEAPPAGVPPERHAYDERLKRESSVDIRCDGGHRETHVDEDGLRIPRHLREFDQQIIIRTPAGTIQHFGSDPLDAYYGMVTPDDFGPVEEIRDPRNADLAPNKVSIKPQGEDAEVFEVEVKQDLRADGGHHEGIEITGLPYQCRSCQHEQTVYVDVERLDGERVVDAHNVRLFQGYCDDCHCERTWVLATDDADAARDGHPIQAVRDLHRKRAGEPLAADGGKR